MRIQPIKPGTDPGLAAMEEVIARRRGSVSMLYRMLLNSPNIAEGWEKLLSAIRYDSSVPADIRELVILRIAVLNGAEYEFEAHRKPAAAAGLDHAMLEAVVSSPLPPGRFSAGQRLALALADRLSRDVEVDSGLFDKLLHAFGQRTTLELIVTVAAYNMVSRVLVALDLRASSESS